MDECENKGREEWLMRIIVQYDSVNDERYVDTKVITMKDDEWITK
jgi:hypothetical protein